MGFRRSKWGGKFVHVLPSFGLKKYKNLQVYMISAYQKLLPEGKREEKGMEKEQLYLKTRKYDVFIS